MMFALPLEAGTRVFVLKQADVSDEVSVNQCLSKLESEAWSAGFVTDVKSVTQFGQDVVIMYVLSEDMLFNPPM